MNGFSRSLLNDPVAFNNWKQREGLTKRSGNISDYISLIRLKEKLKEGAKIPEVIKILAKFKFSPDKIDFHLTKPFDFSPNKANEIRQMKDRSIVHGLVCLCSTRKKADSLSDEIFKQLEGVEL